MPVVAVATRIGDINITLNALGTVTSLATVTVKTQIAGQLTQIAFQEGQIVKQGDFLAQIDPRPYQLTLEQDQGQIIRDQALLKEAEIDMERYHTLVDQDSLAKITYDQQVSLVQQYRGTVASDQAQIDTAKLNLAYCHIVSPVTGRVGIRQVDQGNYVQTSDANGIVIITQLQPISVIFTVPEDYLPQVLKRLRAGATLPVSAYDRTQTTKLADGILTTVDNEIDTTTGTVKMRAQFDNKDESLFPNQVVNAQLLVDVLRGTPVVPVSAVQRGAPGTYVYLVNEDNTVSVRPITIGPGTPELQSVSSGLADGDKVVIDGADKLKEGAQVQVSAPEERNAAGTPGAAGAPGDGEPKRRHRHKPPGDGDAAAGDAKDAPAGAPGSPDAADPGPAGANGQPPAHGTHAGPGGHGAPGDGAVKAPAAVATPQPGSTPPPGSTPQKDEKAP